MIILRERNYSKLSGLKNKIKAVPRHLKRAINQGKAGAKIATFKEELSPEEVKALAVTYRGAKVPGSKTAKRMEKLVKGGKITKEAANKEAEAWGRIHKQGEGAKLSNSIFNRGYYSPTEIEAGLDKGFLERVLKQSQEEAALKKLTKNGKSPLIISPFGETGQAIDRIAKMK